MKKRALPPCLLIALAMASAPFALAQGALPAAQPKRLTIIREEVKVGRAGDHGRNEAGWPAALEKAKSPVYYIAVTSMTGPAEAWYMESFESYAAEAATMKHDEADPVLMAETERLAARDAEFTTSSTTIQTIARPELSVGKFPDLAKTRFYQIAIYWVRPGQGTKFESIVKATNASRLRVQPNSSYRVYSVTAGMPGGTYIVMTSVEDYAQFDQLAKERQAARDGMTPAEKAELDKYGDVVARSQINLFRVDPVQSYVPKETREKDPDFWMKK